MCVVCVVRVTPSGPDNFWALDGTLDHCSKAERRSPIVASSLSVIVVLALPCVTSNVSIVVNRSSGS